MALAAVIGLYISNNRQGEEAYRAVQHTHEVIETAQPIPATLLRIESISRYFVITGESAATHIIDSNETRLVQYLTQLRLLVADNPAQQKRIDQLQTHVNARILFARKVIETYLTRGKAAAEQMVATAYGKELTAKISSLLNSIVLEERAILEGRRSLFAKNSRTSHYLFGGIAVFIVGTLIWIAMLIAKNQRFRDRYEAALQTYRHFFNNSNDLSCIANPTGYFEVLNPRFEQALGYTDKELLSKPFLDFVHPDDHESTSQEMSTLKDGGSTVDLVNRYRRKDGSYVWLEWNASGDPLTEKIYAIARDVTERIAREQEIAHAQQRLISLNHELEAFSYSVSHDLRAPLRAINGFSKIILEDYSDKLDAEGQSLLNTVVNNARRMGELIDALLAFSRLGRKEVSRMTIDMNLLVSSIVEEEKKVAPKVRFTVKNLPAASGDQVLLQQVWINLISNGVKYSQHRELPEVEIGYADDNGREGAYYVKDNGAGFDMAYYDKLFGVFQRLHSQQEFEGTGIGLAMVRKIIDRHGGMIWATAEVDKGATFFFTLSKE